MYREIKFRIHYQKYRMWLEIKKKTLKIISFLIFTIYSKTEYFVKVNT